MVTGASSQDSSASQAASHKDREVERLAAMYAILCVLGVSKLGITLQGSNGHADRIQGKPAEAFWGSSMYSHVIFSLGECTLAVAIKRLHIYELIRLLGHSPILVDVRHEVVLLSSCSPEAALFQTPGVLIAHSFVIHHR